MSKDLKRIGFGLVIAAVLMGVASSFGGDPVLAVAVFALLRALDNGEDGQ